MPAQGDHAVLHGADARHRTKKEAPGIDCRAPLRRSAQSQSWQLSVVSVQLCELLGVPQLLIVVGVLLKNVMS